MLRVEKLLILLFCLVFLVSGDSFAQTQDSYEYQSEFTWGINKNTSGGLIGGIVFKKARKLNDRWLETFGLELMNVKHPQEVREILRPPGTSSSTVNRITCMQFVYNMEGTSSCLKRRLSKARK